METLNAFSSSILTNSWVLIQAVLSTDPFMAEASAIHFVNIADNIADQKDKVVRKLSGPKGRITRLVWTDLNRVVISASEDGFVRRWDVEVRTHCCTGHSCLALHCHPLYLRWQHLASKGGCVQQCDMEVIPLPRLDGSPGHAGVQLCCSQSHLPSLVWRLTCL